MSLVEAQRRVEQMEREHAHVRAQEDPPFRLPVVPRPSQKDRVLARLRNGPVTPVDFAAPDVVDGGKPIMRLARVIGDLEHKDGYKIAHGLVKTLGGAHVAQYELIAEALPESPRVAPKGRYGIPKPPRLWVATSDRGEWCGHWHTHASRAAQCARSQERYFRLRYSERQEWHISAVKVPGIEPVAAVERRAA